MKTMNQMVRTSQQLAAAIRRARRLKALTQAQLAEQCGIRQATISEIERGESEARLGTLMDILTALDLELNVRTRTPEP